MSTGTFTWNSDFHAISDQVVRIKIAGCVKPGVTGKRPHVSVALSLLFLLFVLSINVARQLVSV